MAQKNTQVVHDSWDTFVRETEDFPVFISFDVDVAQDDLSGTLQHCACVNIPVHNPGPSGGPQEPENERLWELEDQLCAALSNEGVDCRLVGRLTFQGWRVLVFQLDDWAAFRPPLQQWIDRCRDYKIQVEESDGWDYYDEHVRPTAEDWLFMADAQVIQQLIAAGSNPDKEHVLDFVLIGEAEPLTAVARQLQADGFQPQQPLNPASGQIVMMKTMALDLSTVAAQSYALFQLADEHGIQYDGWGAAVVT
jgi:regulator of RNase E activity RraB